MAQFLIIPGFAKAGTSYLFDQIRQNAERVNAPPLKEINFFSTAAYRPSRATYLERFPDPDETAPFLDASPSYLQTAVPIAPRIQATLGGDDVRFVISVRNPVSAFYALYLQHLKGDICTPKGLAEVDSYALTDVHVLRRYLRPRFGQVDGLLQSFGKDRVLGLTMPSLFSGDIHRTIGDFAGIPLRPFDPSKRVNAGGFVPYCVYGGEAGAELSASGHVYHIPPGALVVVSNESSRLYPDFDPDLADRALRLCATFTYTESLPKAFFRGLIEDYHRICERLGLEPEAVEPDSFHTYSAPRATLRGRILKQLSSVERVVARAERVTRAHLRGQPTAEPSAHPESVED